ncbi:MAG: tRNA (adenosine(37)-N6)-threonylcarbamoyltransferase complex ATPase subunit type 1 TsaE [Chromatiaceae bacterium]
MKLTIQGEASQETLGGKLAPLLRPPLIVYLEGDLGTGKTTLTRGILRGLGHGGAVRSPTYTLLEPYDLGPLRLYHLDLYRLGDPEELEYLGLRDLLDRDSVLFVEWPQRGGGALPPPDLEIRLDYRGPGRALDLMPRSPAGAELVRALAAAPGLEDATTTLTAD